MLVRKPSLRLEGIEARLVATVESESGAFSPFELFFAVPRPLVGWLDVSGNAFIPSLLLLAATLKERLLVEAPVSPRLLKQAPCANDLYSAWWDVAPVKLDAEAAPPNRFQPGDGAALFFTRGVDSWYSALRARDGVLPERITHLLYVPDFDRQYSEEKRTTAVKLTDEAAAWLGYPLVTLSTNARLLIDPFVNWERSHGGVLAAQGLAIGSWLSSLVVASSNAKAYDPEPWGSMPQLDQLWSTEQTRVRVDGDEAGRTDKVRALAAHPQVVSRLKVCWEIDTERNCGRCEKCLRTQCALTIAGVQAPLVSFEQPLSLEAVARLPRVPRRFWVDLADSLPGTPDLNALRQVVNDRIAGQTAPREIAKPTSAEERSQPLCAPPESKRATKGLRFALAHRLRGGFQLVRSLPSRVQRPFIFRNQGHDKVARIADGESISELDKQSQPRNEYEGLRLLVVSSAGVRNHGDDAILLSLLQRLQRLATGVVPVVITDGESIPPLGQNGRWEGAVEQLCRSLDPADIQRSCKSYPFASDLAAQVGAEGATVSAPVDFSSFDCVLFAGGGNLTDEFAQLTARRTALAAAALARGVPYIVSGQGIGPITSPLRDQLAFLVKDALHFGVRDPLSLEELHRLPIPCDHAEVIGDDALGLALPSPSLIDSLLRDVGVPLDQPLLGFHAREANYVGSTPEELQRTAAKVDELAAQNGQAVLCIPINTQPWAPETVLLASLMVGLKERRARWFLVDPRERVDIVAALVARCKAMVSHSYHVALFALAAGVPVLLQASTEYYRRKAEGLRQYFQVGPEIGMTSQASTHWMTQQFRRMSKEPWSALRTLAQMDEWLRRALPVRRPSRDQISGASAQSIPSPSRAAA